MCAVPTKPHGETSSPRRWRVREGHHFASGHFSRTTSLAFLSCRSPTKRLCRRWSFGVHSRNSNCARSTGLNQIQSAIFFTVRPCPQRPLCSSGRLTNGHLGVSSPSEPFEQLLAGCRRESIAGPRHVEQLPILVIAENQGSRTFVPLACIRASGGSSSVMHPYPDHRNA